MPHLFGKNWSREQLEPYTGSPWQIGSIRHMRFMEGLEDGTEVVQIDNGAGLQYNVLPSRGLDIATARYRGASLGYESPTGEAHPAHYDPQGLGWLKSFYAGLLTTCGLTWAGAPSTDQGQALGLHGRVSHLPARNLKIGDDWVGDERRLWVSGDIREGAPFGPNIVMKRTVSTEVGVNKITIEDVVRNDGFRPTPLMLLYHINIGFPVVDENTELLVNSKATPRDEEARPGLDRHHRFEVPTPDYKEQVFYHDIVPDDNGFCHVALVNTAFGNGAGLGIYLRYRHHELPRFAQWKMMGSGTYVCGLEPANCSVQGRAHDRAEGTLQHLQPGEERALFLEISILSDVAGIEALRHSIKGALVNLEPVPSESSTVPIQ